MSSPPRKTRAARKLPGARYLPARLGPKAAEDEDARAAGDGSGLSLRAMAAGCPCGRCSPMR